MRREPSGAVTRRLLLKALLWGGGIVAGVIRCLPDRLRLAGAGRLSPAEASAPITDAELDALVAFAESLVDGQPISAGARRDLIGHIGDSAGRDPDKRALYRMTAAFLDRLAGRPFARLDVGERTGLVTAHRLNIGIITPEESLGAFPEEARALRTRTVPDLIAAYWRSPAGWTALGYEVFPGGCGDLTRYTRPET